MAGQITCKCGMSFLLLQKKPGDIVKCRHCGAEITVPFEFDSTETSSDSEFDEQIDFSTPTVNEKFIKSDDVPAESVLAPSTGYYEQAKAHLENSESKSQSEAIPKLGSSLEPEVFPEAQVQLEEKSFEAYKASEQPSFEREDSGKRKSSLLRPVILILILIGSVFIIGPTHLKNSFFTSLAYLGLIDKPRDPDLPPQNKKFAEDTNTFREELPETPAPDLFESWNISITIANNNEAPETDINACLRIPQNKKVRYKTKFYRAPRKAGKYRLIHEGKLHGFNHEAPTATVPQKPRIARRSSKMSRSKRGIRTYPRRQMPQVLQLSFKDKNPASDKKNHVYYRLDILSEDGELLKTFPPIKVPVIPKPEISENKWTWSPIDPEGEEIEAIIKEYLSVSGTSIMTFVSSLRKNMENKFIRPPEGIALKLKFELPKTPNYKSENKNKIKIATPHGALTLKKAFQEKSQASRRNKGWHIIPSFSRDNFFSRRLAPNKGFRMKKLFINNNKISIDPTQISRLGSFNYGKGGSAKLELELYDEKTNIKSGKKKFEFYLPPRPPNFKIKSTSKGIKIRWKDFSGKIDLSKFVVAPKIGIHRNGLLIAHCDLDETSYLDNGPKLQYGQKYGYKLSLDGGILRTQGWVDGYDSKDFLMEMKEYTGSGHRSRRATAKIKDRSTSNKEKASPELAQETSRPIRVGIWNGEMSHEGTGMLEIAILKELFKALANQKDILVYDRMHTKAILEEILLSLPVEKVKMFKPQAVDYVIRLRDYSHEESNGVSLWITKIIPDQYSLNTTASWRIGRIDLCDKDYSIKKKLIIPLIAKLKSLTEFKIADKKRGKKSTVENIIFNNLKPMEQKSEVWQFRELTESLILELSNKLEDQNVISREDWKLVMRERLALEEDKKSESKNTFSDILISGRVWKGKEKKLNYCFIATELATGKLIDSFTVAGEQEKIVDGLAKWCSALKMPNSSADEKIASSEKLIKKETDLEYLGLDYKESIKFNKPSYYSQRKDSYLSGDSKSVLAYVRKQIEIGDRQRAYKILEDEWKKTKDSKIGSSLASSYHSRGLYLLEAEILKELIKDDGDYRRLNKARSLAKKRGNVVKSFVKKTKSAKRKNLGLSKLGAQSISSIASHKNEQFSEQYFCARSAIGKEWFPNGLIMTKKESLTTPTIEILMEYPYGIWQVTVIKNERKYIGRKNGKRFYTKKASKTVNTEFNNWQSQPLFSGQGKGLIKERYLYLRKQGDGKLRCLWEFIDNPKIKISPVDNETAIDHLKKLLKEAISKSEIDPKKSNTYDIKLNEFVSVYLLAENGNKTAAKFLETIKKIKIKDKWKGVHDAYRSTEFIIFKAFLGNEKAISKLKKNDKNLYFDDYRSKADTYFLLSKASRKDTLLALIANDKYSVSKIDIIRWSNKKLLKEMLLNNLNIMRKKCYRDTFSFLIEGFRLLETTSSLLAVDHWETNQLLVLLHGKPLEEISGD